MDTQTGILGLQGTVGGLVFAKNGTVRQKPASNKAAFSSSSSMARTRENAGEFGRAASGGKLLRDSFRVLIAAASDSQMVSRLTQMMCSIIGMDTTNGRGERVIDKSNIDELLGFNFNQGAGIGQSLFCQYGIAQAGANVTMTIAALNPATDIVAPQGATHFELLYGTASLDFGNYTYEVGTVAAPLGILALNSPALANQNLVAAFPAAPGASDVVVGVVGINFYQSVNGQMYPLNNNATNPLAVEFVA
jgi:hypothetical protein